MKNKVCFIRLFDSFCIQGLCTIIGCAPKGEVAVAASTNSALVKEAVV